MLAKLSAETMKLMKARPFPKSLSKTIASLIFVFLAFELEVKANSVHEKCLSAADYKGCVEVLSGTTTTQSISEKLEKAIKRLPSRLENTNLRDFTSNTQFIDDLIVDIDKSSLKSNYEKFLYDELVALADMKEALQIYWSTRIKVSPGYGKDDSYWMDSRCRAINAALKLFNIEAGPKYAVQYNGSVAKTWLGDTETCRPQEPDLLRSIAKRSEQATKGEQYWANALKERELRQQRLEESRRLGKMEPWARHLEENPGIKAWAEANPEAAKKAMEKFLSKLKNTNQGQSPYPTQNFRYTSIICQDNPYHESCK